MLIMTDYDDTLIDMPYEEVEEVETSSLELDEHTPISTTNTDVSEAHVNNTPSTAATTTNTTTATGRRRNSSTGYSDNNTTTTTTTSSRRRRSSSGISYQDASGSTPGVRSRRRNSSNSSISSVNNNNSNNNNNTLPRQDSENTNLTETSPVQEEDPAVATESSDRRPGLTSRSHSNQSTTELTATTTTTTTPSTTNTTSDDSNVSGSNISSSRRETEGNNMSENAKLEEKLRQFKNDCKNDDNEDTRGTYHHMSELEKQRRRNLIFDEERFEETFLKCLICREVYNEVDKLPKMLHCHHTFCMDCLYQMYRVEGEFRQSLTGVFRGMPMTVKIQCPTCREGIIISEAELRRLPNDHTIMELLCFVSQTGKNEVQYCTKHQMQPLNFFCEPCIMPVCCDCTVIDHKESKGHVVVNVDEAMKKYTPIVEETMGDIKCEKANLAEKRQALESAQDDLDQIQKDLTTQIRSVFDSIREMLDERERELYDIADTEIERKREILDGHMRVLVDRESQLNSEFNELQKAKDDKDISLLFTGHKSAREVLSNQVHVPTNSTKGFSVTFQFSSRSDSIIKQQVANLGDIIFQSS